MQSIVDQQLVKTSSYINGQWISVDTKFNVDNPATQQTLLEVDNAGVAQVELAIAAAKQAKQSWAALSANQRGEMLDKWYQLMMLAQADLARILTLEQGKPLAEATGEIAYGAGFIQWFAQEGKRVYGDTIPSLSPNQRIVVIKQPVGVVAAITPWNFPNAMLARKAAAALAAGCTFVARPSEKTPLSALAMAELAHRAGIPDGVFNVVVGDDAVGMGQVLTDHPDVAKLTFTGSTRVGKLLIAQCANTVKKVSMELGGNAPFIVFEDADIDAAVAGVMAAKFRNAGQTCVSANRVFVHHQVKHTFVEKLVLAMKTLALGNGLEQATMIGPLISAQALDTVDQLVAQSLAQGATLSLGGQPLEASNFYPPTLVDNVTNDMPIARSEIFGPVVPIISFDNEAEVIAMANDTEYGLAAYFYARDIGRVWRVSEGLDFGMVGINEGVISNVAAPFGGVKASGSGREGSKYGLDDYLEIKYLCMGGLRE